MIYRSITITCTKDNLKREKISMYEHGAVSFEFTCLNGNQQIDLSEYTKASYHGTKSDGCLIRNKCEIKDGKVILPISLQMTTAPGILQGVVVLYSESGNVRFNGVNFEVLECPDEADIESTDEFTVLEDMIDEVHKLIDEGIEASQGKSAYEIALDNGFEGTEKEWLESLKGADGVGEENVKNIGEINRWQELRTIDFKENCIYRFMAGGQITSNYPSLNSSDCLGIYTKEVLNGESYPTLRFINLKNGKCGQVLFEFWIYSEFNTPIVDENNYYTNKTVDGAFAEIGKQLKNINSDAYKQEIADIIKNEYEAELLEILGGDEDVTE